MYIDLPLDLLYQNIIPLNKRQRAQEKEHKRKNTHTHTQDTQMRGDLAKRLKDPNDKHVFVLDGGQGTELENRGIKVSNPIWSTVPFLDKSFWDVTTSHEGKTAKSPERQIVEGMYHDFINTGGCDICMTITYQSSFKSIKENTEITTLAEYQQLMGKIVDFTREVIGEEKYLVGCVGPYGAHICCEFTGDYGSKADEIDYYEYFKPQLDVFFAETETSNKLDMIGFETIPNFHEIKAILSWNESILNKPYYIGLSVNDDGKLRDGTELRDICQYIRELHETGKLNPNFTMLGANCVSFNESINMIKDLNKNLQNLNVPLIVYPNSGEVYDTEQKVWMIKDNNKDNLSIFTWDSYVPQYIANNCKIIGGCCRTTPNDIKCIRSAVDSYNTTK